MENIGQNNPLRLFRSQLGAESTMFHRHHHTAFEITAILSGGGIYATEFTEYEFKKYDIFFFSTDEIHWIKKLDSDASFINLHFEPRFIWSENLGISNKELMKIFFCRKKTAMNKIDANSDTSDTILRLLFEIEKEIAEKNTEYETMVKIRLVNILIEIMRCYDGKLKDIDISYNPQLLKHMEEAINYIDANLGTELSLQKLADTAHMSKTYFCSQFKKLNGISPWDYITIKRIEQAVSYIENTDMTRLEIAIKCGFNNTSNFYHAFRKITGKSPADYVQD